jgi:hypothetical protein
MIGGEDRIHLPAQKVEKLLHVEPMQDRRIRAQIFLCEAKQPHRGKHSPPIFGVRRPLKLLLQMDEAAGRLDQAFEIVRVLIFRAQPEVFEHVVRFVVALRIPAKKEAGVARMLRNFPVRTPRGRAAQLLDEPGNSLVFVHGEFSLVSAEMTGNRARRVFAGEGPRSRRAAVGG